MAEYWMKLYMEILDDPKMATLPDRLWRRVIELFLLAGRFNKQGHLPDTRQLAWVLRTSPDDLDMDLRQIESIGVIQRTGEGWYVVNFQKRQAPSTEAERKRQQRERDHRRQYYVTNLSRNVTQIRSDTDTDTEADTEAERGAPLLPLLSRVSGLSAMPPKEMERVEQILSLIDDHGLEKAEVALKQACDKWKRTPRKNSNGNYSVTNMGWVDWAQDELVGKPPEKKFEDCTTVDEMIEWHNTHQA